MLRQVASGEGSGRHIRLAALVALFLAVSLCAWRASSLLMVEEPGPQSPAESSLARLVDPLVGAGNSRISITFNAAGGRTVFVLLDASAAPIASDLERILPEAASLDLARGDRLVIQQAVFVRGLPGRPDTSGWLELGALGLISLLSAGIAAATLRSQAVDVAVPAPAREAEPSSPERVRPLRPVAPIPAADAGDVARRDPARGAAVLRGWMSGEDAS